MNPRPICVLGLGLIGGSLVRVASGAGRKAWGATASTGTADAARADGYDVEPDLDSALRRAAAEDALVVLSMPLPHVPDVLRRVHACAPECRLTDVVSVKAAVRDAVRRLAPAARYVGGHPMAGTAESGWAAGSAELFLGARWVVAAEDGSDPEVWADVAELAWDSGSLVVPAGAEEHDAAVGRISHLPHLLAAVLAATAADSGPGGGLGGGPGGPGGIGGGPGAGVGGTGGASSDSGTDGLALSLAAGSFADGTRVAGTRPELVLAMCEGNRDGLLAAVDDALGRLGAARGSLASTGGLAATVNAGYRARQRWVDARETEPVRVARGTGMAELRELGRQGAAIAGWA